MRADPALVAHRLPCQYANHGEHEDGADCQREEPDIRAATSRTAISVLLSRAPGRIQGCPGRSCLSLRHFNRSLMWGLSDEITQCVEPVHVPVAQGTVQLRLGVENAAWLEMILAAPSETRLISRRFVIRENRVFFDEGGRG